MNLPPGITEEEFVAIVDKVTKNLVYKIQFAYHTPEDLKQEAIIEAYDALKKYDSSKPLENFLSVCLKNKLLNFKRKRFSRKEPPCQKCPFYCPKSQEHPNFCEIFDDKNDCEKWTNWIKRNEIKENLAKPGNLNVISDEEEASVQVCADLDDFIDGSTLREKIDYELPVEFRADYLRFMAGATVPKHRMQKLKQKMLEILGVEIDEDA